VSLVPGGESPSQRFCGGPYHYSKVCKFCGLNRISSGSFGFGQPPNAAQPARHVGLMRAQWVSGATWEPASASTPAGSALGYAEGLDTPFREPAAVLWPRYCPKTLVWCAPRAPRAKIGAQWVNGGHPEPRSPRSAHRGGAVKYSWPENTPSAKYHIRLNISPRLGP
jgi:hypothetical protein